MQTLPTYIYMTIESLLNILTFVVHSRWRFVFSFFLESAHRQQEFYEKQFAISTKHPFENDFKIISNSRHFSPFAFLSNDSRKNKKYAKLNVLRNQLFVLKIASTSSLLSDLVSSSVESNIRGVHTSLVSRP